MHHQQTSSGVCWNRRWFNNKTVPSPSSSTHDLQSLSHSLHSSPSRFGHGGPVGLTLSEGLDTKHSFDINRNTTRANNIYDKVTGDKERMDHDEDVDYVKIVPLESYEVTKAKQRASIKWLLSKAYNNKTPEDLLEPFYKDHDGEEHLKPHIVKGLSDAELYCLALCNLYADPNYSQLSPWGIVQALARKGSYVQTPPEMHLTETILMQNRPLRVNAHIPVIEAMMVLHVRELISTSKIVDRVQRYGSTVHPREMPSDIEEALLLWINRAVLAIKEYVQSNNSREHGLSQTQVECWTQLPLFQDFSDLTDGVGLCALLAFYCQDELSLSEITVPNPGEPLNISESLWNLQLIQRVCRDSLPFNVCHFNFEDILYFSDPMKQNMLSFLADIFNLVELNPSSVVKLLGSHREMFPVRPGFTGEGVRIRRGFVQQCQIQAIPDLRTSLYTYSSPLKDRNNTRSLSAQSTPKKNTVQIHDRTNSRKSATNIYLGDASSGRKSPTNASVVSVPVRRSGTPQDYSEKAHSVSDRSNKDHRYYTNSSEDSEEFVVHRGRNVPTLSQVIRSMSPSSQDERSSPASRMSQSRNQTMSNDLGDESGIPAAGRPSNLGANKTTYAGRRSRRNSFTEADSQLTVENFGGSQDNLNRFTVSRNPDKQPAVLTETLISPVRYPKRQTSVEPPDYYAPPVVEPQRIPTKERLSSSSDDGRIEPQLQSVFYGRKKPGLENQTPTHINRTYSQPAEDVPYASGSFHYQQPGSPHTGDPYSHRTPEREPYHVPARSTSMTNLSRLSDVPNKPVNIVYLSNATTNGGSGYYNSNGYSDRLPYLSSQEDSHSYQQHSNSRPYSSPSQGRLMSTQSRQNDLYYHPPHPQPQHQHGRSYGDDEDEDLAAEISALRSKLEEKRRRIEFQKGRMESFASKQQFKIGKAAYLKAINKSVAPASNMQDSLNISSSCGRKGQLMLQDLESKWSNKTDEPCRTPEIENMDKHTYQKSLARYDKNLAELEQDMNKLTVQEAQLSRRTQFFLHAEPEPTENVDTVKRKTWTVPNDSSSSRVQWEPTPSTTEKDKDSYRPTFNGELRHGTSSTNGGGPSSSFRLHSNADSQGNRLFNKSSSESKEEEEKPTPPPRQRSSVTVHHAPLPTPPPDDMEPQSVCFVQEDNPPSSSELNSIASSKKSQITSGSKTYRITPESGSPPRPSAHRLFISNDGTDPSSDEQPSTGDRGFYIPMDEAPKRPKPPLPNKAVRRANGEDGEAMKRDLSSEYVSSIVNHPPPSSNNSNDDEDFRVQKYTHREGSYEDDEGRLGGGELVIDEKKHYDPTELDEMEKKKERILLQSLRRQQMVEEQRQRKEFEAQRKRELEARKAEEKERKKEEDKARKQAILESYRMKKQDDSGDKEGFEVQETKKFLRPKSATTSRQRPKTIHLSEVDSAPTNMYGHRIGSGMLHRSDSQTSSTGLSRSYGKNGSSSALYSNSGVDRNGGTQSRSSRRDPWGSTSSLNQDNRRGLGTIYNRDRGRSQSRPRDLSTSRIEARSRRDNYMGSQDYLGRGNSTSSLLDGIVTNNSTTANLEKCPTTSDAGKELHQRRPESPTILLPVGPSPTTRPKRPDSLPQATKAAHSMPSPSAAPSSKPWPGSLPPGLVSRRGRNFDDGASDISSVVSSNMDYSGNRLYKQPTAKSNRGIILNAVEYCVFPGAVNHESKMRVLDEIHRSEAKHFLIMFRDAGCQFRALYAYIPESDEIAKLYGVGPRCINETMFEKFFKYNSGSKCFTQVHTKHLTVTIDAFTIHNALWQGKKGPQARGGPMVI